MNDTNRALNRALIAVVGIVLIAVGGVVAAASIVPAIADGWRDGSDAAGGWIGDLLANTGMAGGDHSWMLVAIVAAAALVVVLLLVFALRQGRGHTRTLVSRGEDRKSKSGDADAGYVRVDAAVARQLIEEALSGHPGIVSSSVSAYRVRSVPALKVAVTVRRGVSPADVREYVDGVVARWDELLGEETPVLVTIGSGLVARMARTTNLTELPSA
jgi:uncharacterized membrane protein